MGAVDTVYWACEQCGHCIQNDWVEQWICIKFCIKLEHSLAENIEMIQKATAMSNWWLAASSQQHKVRASRLMQSFLGKHQIAEVTQPPYSQDVVPCDFWLFLRLKSPLKGKRLQTINEIQENTMGQLMVIGRTVRCPKVPTLKNTEVSFFYVQCFLYVLQ